jgi:hypothetical protein
MLQTCDNFHLHEFRRPRDGSGLGPRSPVHHPWGGAIALPLDPGGSVTIVPLPPPLSAPRLKLASE